VFVAGCGTGPSVSGTWTGTLVKNTHASDLIEPFMAYELEIDGGPCRFDAGARAVPPDLPDRNPILLTSHGEVWMGEGFHEGERVRVSGSIAYHPAYIHQRAEQAKAMRRGPDGTLYSLKLSRQVKKEHERLEKDRDRKR
jgi:hypothetical protein